MVYQASPIKRHRATSAEMEERALFLIAYAEQHAPVTVRQLFYAATVANIPGVEKTEGGYSKVQTQVLKLRREGRLAYNAIADATRYMRKPRTFDGWEDALARTAEVYRKDLWAENDVEVEIWLEKSALAGVLTPVTFEFDVPLMPTMGYTSETFAHDAVSRLQNAERRLIIYALYDFDRSGKDAERSLEEKVRRFGEQFDVPVEFYSLGLSALQVEKWNLPTRPPKRKTTADKNWPYPYAAELDAIPPELLRQLVRDAIEQHLPPHELEALKATEAMERETLNNFIYEGAA